MSQAEVRQCNDDFRRNIKTEIIERVPKIIVKTSVEILPSQYVFGTKLDPSYYLLHEPSATCKPLAASMHGSRHEINILSSHSARCLSRISTSTLLSESTTDASFVEMRNKDDTSDPESTKTKVSAHGISLNKCLCLIVWILFFLCAVAVLITFAVLIISRIKSPPTSSTVTKTRSTSTSSSTVTTSITTETTTTAIGITWLTTTRDIINPIWNTTAGQDSTQATAGTGIGNFYPAEIPRYAFDNTTTTKYTSFGFCTFGQSASSICGVNTGLYLTPQRGPSSLVNIQFCTANDLVNRDPLTVTVEGSNQPSSSLTLGSTWILIYNGSTGLDSVLTRFQCGPVVLASNNSNWYSSYRVLITSIRGTDVATQYSELRLMGYQ